MTDFVTHPQADSARRRVCRTIFGYRTSRRFPLSLKFAVAFVSLVTLVLLIDGAVNVWLDYQEAKRAAIDVQREKARGAAERVEGFLAAIENQIGWTTRIEWSHIGTEQQRYDFIRLLRQTPAITEVSYIDSAGIEQLKVSRLEPDTVASSKDFSADPRFLQAVANKVWFGPVNFRRGSEPYMIIAVAHTGRAPGVTVADVNLKLVWDVITSLRIGERGFAFVVTAEGRLIADPDLSLVLRNTDLGHLQQVTEALPGAGRGIDAVSRPEIVDDIAGLKVLSAHAAVARVGWIVFVQSPLSEVMVPVYRAVLRTIALLSLGLLLATILGTVTARRLVVPIRRLQQGAERLGGGDLSERIVIRTGDEIETLADRFNTMASRVQESYETLEERVEQRTRELRASLDDLRTAQDRLVQSEKLASLGQLTAGIAHEIKNPLNFINNFSALSGELVDELQDVLRTVPFDTDLRNDVDVLADMLKGNLAKVVQHGRRADSIVKNMLLHSRSDSGERRHIDLNGLVEESVNLAYHGARAENPGFAVTLVKAFDPDAGQIDVHPQEISRVILNLISNGFYAAAQRDAGTSEPDFEPTVKVSTTAWSNAVEIRIRDNGTGIPDEVRPKVFDPFFTTKPSGEGTGLGLSLSHDIVVKHHGGTIEVTTQPGVFSEFTIRLPRGGPPLTQDEAEA